MQKTYTTFTESLTKFYRHFVEQLPGIALAIIIIVLGILIASWIGRFSRRKIKSKTSDPLMSNFLSKSIKYTLIIISIMLGLRAAGLEGYCGGYFDRCRSKCCCVRICF
ncbi:MAG: hypothetical protein QMB24_08925 [Spirosomataceae bacterium]|jgi:small conductance mechanosensitive channel